MNNLKKLIPSKVEVVDYAMLEANKSPRPATYLNAFTDCYEMFIQPIKDEIESIEAINQVKTNTKFMKKASLRNMFKVIFMGLVLLAILGACLYVGVCGTY